MECTKQKTVEIIGNTLVYEYINDTGKLTTIETDTPESLTKLINSGIVYVVHSELNYQIY